MQHLLLCSAIGEEGVAKSFRDRIDKKGLLKTVFITTPVEPPGEQQDLSWYETDRSALREAGFDIFDYTVTGKTPQDLENDLVGIDAIYVSGGNTRHLLHHSQASGFDNFVRQFVKSGKPYISTSAGSIITAPYLPQYFWGEDAETPYCTDFNAYNLVNFNFVPHWGSSWFKDLYLKGRMDKIYVQDRSFVLCNDYEYVEVLGDKYRIIDVRRENEG